MNDDEMYDLVFWLLMLAGVVVIVVLGIYFDALCPAYLCPPMGFQ